jgi:hypothetical protein
LHRHLTFVDESYAARGRIAPLRQETEMAKKTRLTAASSRIGAAVGRADRTARKVAKAVRVAREELTQLSRKVKALGRDLEKTKKRLKRTLR